MSWRDQIDNQIVIITGDRKRYTPQWRGPLFRLPFNVSSFNFPNVKGTLVKKFQPQGAKYPLEFFFQGEDHLDTAKEFRASCDDTRHWHILHPLYGDIRVQPSELEFDNKNPNITAIKGVFLETLPNNFPNNTITPEDEVNIKKENTDALIASGFESNSPAATATDLITLEQTADVLASKNQNLLTTDEDFNEFTNLLETVKRELVLDGYSSINAITALQDMINFPVSVAKSVDQRVKAYVSQLERLDTTIKSISDVPKALKVQFESISATLMSALALIVSTKESEEDYGTRAKVIETIDLVLATYNNYIDTLDLIQSDDAEQINSFIPDYDSQIALNDVINFAVANLFDIASNAKQERSVFIEEDSDIISLTHRFLGVDADDLNIDEFILNNEIGISEHLLIKKGRKIIYFV